MNIAISGAGIGGLTAALCLLKSGHKVSMLEQARQLSEVGAGVQCGANALHVLQHLGLEQEVFASAVQPESVLFRDFKSGQILHQLTLGEQYQQQFSAPYLHVYRADLQRVLLAALDQLDAQALQLNTQVMNVEQSNSSVVISTRDGRTLEADCLIAADGIRSAIRQQMFPSAKPVYSGYQAWRIMVPTHRLPEGWMDTVTANFVGPGKHCVIYYVRNRELVNMVGVIEAKHQPTKDDWINKAPKSALLEDFEGWHPTVSKLIEAVDEDKCYRWSLNHLTPLKKWGQGRVALLGDAAHAALPFMAAGAAMAMEDARILDRCLQGKSNIESALNQYRRNRVKRTKTIQNDSARLGKLYHLSNPMVRRAAFTGLRIMGQQKQDFLPSYNANRVALI